MLLGILRQINWVDILVLLVAARVCYIAAKRGFFIELFKLLGTVLGIYLAFHYYTLVSDWVGKRIKIPGMPLDFFDFIFFIILFLLGYAIFILLRETFTHLVKTEVLPKLNAWGGFILGIGRAVLLSSLIIYMLAISSINYLKNSVVTSYSGKSLFRVSVLAYTTIWDKFMSKFMAKEKLNKIFREIEDDLKI